ncbi:sialidase family protein [Chitinophaga nivalis]|uniref:Glycoside hydrolase n=1 Tax=Chitinophaga nivalis TaxID=2991709 RepID=A0ABT3ISN8_9BACT|nr:sialidase family protein [Chitinophaga nivalis]MCW3463317.1 glycoside hydrolase [Chitinophaga nivalis]MCW3486993.1 glycoside hydrolase [Chitinophaga nivalis]
MKPLIAGIIVWLLVSCQQGNTPKEQVHLLSGSGRDASCPFITKDATGHPVISWVEKEPAADTGTMYYAVANDDGYTFGTPVRIPVTTGVRPHDENLPKLLFKPDGTVIVMFGVEQHDARNKYAGKVMYAQSFDKGSTWEPAVPLVTDTAGYDQRYFDMALLPSGEAAAIWLDNRKDTQAEGSTLYFATTAAKAGFQEARPIAGTVCQCCRTKLYVAGNGDIHVAYRDIINDTIRDMVHQVSVNKGQTFSAPVRISADNWVINGCPHTGPALTANSQGLHFTWFTMGGGQGVFYCRSPDNGHTYTQKESLSKSPMAKHPQLATTTADQVAIVWDEPVKWRDGFNSRIGFQLKSAAGKTMTAKQLTPDSVYAAFPVISAIQQNQVLVAYKEKTGDTGRIAAVWLDMETMH